MQLVGPPAGATRNRPISDELRAILEEAAEATGVTLVRITSGGQPGTHGRSVGSTRHNGGRAADVQLEVDGSTKTFTDTHGGPVFTPFVTAVAALGATGIGAGVAYMGNRTIHVGFGRDASDTTKLVWGAQGRSDTAPQWLRDAAQAGWSAPRSLIGLTERSDELPGRFVVTARSGLKLRSGPGLDFGVQSVLPTGQTLTVVAMDGPNRDWARVDIEDDGRVDGHVLAAYLRRDHSIILSRFEDDQEPA